MKKIIIVIFAVFLIITGCSANKIAIMGVERRNDVFQEVAPKDSVPVGFADLTIVSTLKTRKPGDFLWSKSSRGTPEYTLLLNIDGQTIRVIGNLTEEKTTSGGPWNQGAEAGEGIRYFFKKDLRLKPGLHRVFVALPEDGVYLDQEITIKDGTDNVLVLTPVYGKRKVGRLPDLNAPSSFYEGIRCFNGYLNGKGI